MGFTLEDAPQLVLRRNPRILPLWIGFHDLSRRRGSQLGFGVLQVNPIPYSEILGYCNLHAIVPEERGSFAEHVIRMDDVYLEVTNRKLAEEAKKK